MMTFNTSTRCLKTHPAFRLGASALLACFCAFATFNLHGATEASAPDAQQRTVEALGMLEQVVSQVGDCVRRKELSSVHVEDVLLGSAMAAVFEVARALPVPVQAEFQKDVEELGKHLGELHYVSDLKKQAQAEKQLLLVLQSLGRIKAHFPAATVKAANAIADRYVCPSHPEVAGRRMESCAKCGRALEQQWRLVAGRTNGPYCSVQTVKATIRVEAPIFTGRETRGVLTLSRMDGKEIFPTDLMMTHGSKIHLLLIDPSLADYHHVHPVPTGKAGDYQFAFTASKPGTYLAWADIRPAPMGLHEFASATVAAVTKGLEISNRTPTDSATVDGIKFQLRFTEPQIRAGKAVRGKLRVTTESGAGFQDLEPVMEAFAHFAGFHEDRRTVVHFHPTGLPITSAKARGGPELEFIFFTTQPGLIRLFAEVQIDGRQTFAPFNIQVAP